MVDAIRELRERERSQGRQRRRVAGMILDGVTRNTLLRASGVGYTLLACPPGEEEIRIRLCAQH